MTPAGTGPRRVLLCATGFPRWDGDAHKTFLLDHALALADAGVEVTVLCPRGPGLPRRHHVGGIEVLRFAYAPRRWETLGDDDAMYRKAAGPGALLVPALVAAFVVAAIRTARRHRVDVVHAHWWVPTGLVGLLAAASSGAASVVHLHGSDAAVARGPLRLLARWVLRRADLVLAASEDLAAWAAGVTGGPTPAVVPMPLAVRCLRSPSPPPGDGPVLAVGRLAREKGFDVLVEAAARLGQRVVLVGDGPERDGLRALAEEVGADVTFVGALTPAEVGAWYGRARVVAVPSRREGFGMVAAEAAASGRAVVGSAVGALPQLVVDGVSGLLVPPGDVSALTEALRAVDPGMGRHGPDQVGWLQPEAHAAAIVAAYDEAISRRSDRAGR